MIDHLDFVASVDAFVCRVLAYPLLTSHHLFHRIEYEANSRKHFSRNAWRPKYDVLGVSVHHQKTQH